MELKTTNSNYGIDLFLDNFTSRHTRRAYETDLKTFFTFLRNQKHDSTNPKDLKLEHFVLYRDALLNKGLAPSTVNRRLASLKSLMKWFLLEGYVEGNPMEAIKLMKASVKTPTQAFSDEEVLDMLSSSRTLTHKIIMMFLFNLGLRRSELADIALSDIYEDRGHTILLIRGKGGKTRSLPLNDNLKTVLDKYKKTITGTKLFNISSDGVYKLIKRYVKKVGINKNLSPHSCRATVISYLLENGESPRNVADFAGHSSINTTVGIYDKKRKGLDDSSAYKVNFK